MRKILIISPFQFRLRRGIERFTYVLSNQLARDYNLKIIIYTWSSFNNMNWGEWHENILIRRVPYFRFYEKLIAKIFYLKWIRKDKPSHVIINFLYHGETCLPSDLKCYYILHSPASLIPHRYSYIAENIRKFNNICGIAVSDFVKSEAESFFQGNPIEIIYHGVCLNDFKSSAQYYDKPKLKIVTISALEEWKGSQDVIKALSSPVMREYFEFDIYGEGPYKDELNELIRQLGLEENISLKGSIDNVEDVLPNYDIYCQMSNGEAFGLSLFEAMACGLPTIVYDSPPFDKLIPDQISKKVKNKSINELEATLLKYRDYKERENYGRAAKLFVTENFSVGMMASRYFELFKGSN